VASGGCNIPICKDFFIFCNFSPVFYKNFYIAFTGRYKKNACFIKKIVNSEKFDFLSNNIFHIFSGGKICAVFDLFFRHNGVTTLFPWGHFFLFYKKTLLKRGYSQCRFLKK